MISLDEARQIIGSHTRVLHPEAIDLTKVNGRVLAHDISSDQFYPAANLSMMDGYVIREDEQPGSFSVIAEIPAGQITNGKLSRGEAMRIFTGGILPENGGRVVMQEACVREGDMVSINEFPDSLFIREKGAEARPGDLILRSGQLIGPSEMAVLAQLGCTQPQVIRKPRIRHLATGDELVKPTEVPSAGQIRDTNSSLLAGLTAQYCSGMDSSLVPDQPSMMSALAEGDWEVLLISGGASVGDYDHGADVLGEMGFTIHFDQVNLRPGKPLTFATRGNQLAFVIPGNPVSHFVCFHVAIRLALETLCGMAPNWSFLSLEITEQSLLKPNPRETFWPAEILVKDKQWTSRPKSWSSSGNTFSLIGTNALIRVSSKDFPLTLPLNS
ncbi:molybdopterin molybdotransferase MoeA [Luteolibacter algae]|uniref:Molybdopterin molybdenumtransferase n=1 Tax=Luteolibacter algae TaxID=454151 RepID=A0ABW5D9I1_9BACT